MFFNIFLLLLFLCLFLFYMLAKFLHPDTHTHIYIYYSIIMVYISDMWAPFLKIPSDNQTWFAGTSTSNSSMIFPTKHNRVGVETPPKSLQVSAGRSFCGGWLLGSLKEGLLARLSTGRRGASACADHRGDFTIKHRDPSHQWRHMTSHHDIRLLEIQAIEMELSNQWNNFIYIQRIQMGYLIMKIRVESGPGIKQEKYLETWMESCSPHLRVCPELTGGP